MLSGSLFDEVAVQYDDQHELRVRLYKAASVNDYIEVDACIGVLERETGESMRALQNLRRPMANGEVRVRVLRACSVRGGVESKIRREVAEKRV